MGISVDKKYLPKEIRRELQMRTRGEKPRARSVPRPKVKDALDGLSYPALSLPPVSSEGLIRFQCPKGCHYGAAIASSLFSQCECGAKIEFLDPLPDVKR